MLSVDFTAVMNEFTYAKRLAANFSCCLHFNYLKSKSFQIDVFFKVICKRTTPRNKD